MSGRYMRKTSPGGSSGYTQVTIWHFNIMGQSVMVGMNMKTYQRDTENMQERYIK